MAHKNAAATEEQFSLPVLVMTPTDIKRLTRELTVLNDYLQQQLLRTPGQPMNRLPRTSRLLEEVAAVNKLNLLDPQARADLATFFSRITRTAPVIHISFAVDPSSAFLLKIIAWFRSNVHSSALIRVGLQPNIAAGCIVRTTNRYFDLSLRKTLEQKRGVLHDMLVETATLEQATPPVEATLTAGIPTAGAMS